MQIQPMISTHPDVRGSVNDGLVRAIEAAYGCAAVCRICADACLAEEMVKDLTQCIRLDLDCVRTLPGRASASGGTSSPLRSQGRRPRRTGR